MRARRPAGWEPPQKAPQQQKSSTPSQTAQPKPLECECCAQLCTEVVGIIEDCAPAEPQARRRVRTPATNYKFSHSHILTLSDSQNSKALRFKLPKIRKVIDSMRGGGSGRKPTKHPKNPPRQDWSHGANTGRRQQRSRTPGPQNASVVLGAVRKYSMSSKSARR